MSTTRDDDVRAMLVDRVSESRPRRRWRLPLIGIGAFALAGALTAGALVSSGLLQQQADPADATALIDTGAAGDITFLGDPAVRTSDSDTSLTLDARPSSAARLAVAAQCPPPRTVAVTIDGQQVADITCGDTATLIDASAVGGAGGGGIAGAPVVAFSPSADGGYTVWASWAKPDPLPGPSPQQQLATADGVATRTEYLAAWNRYLGCMRALGHPIDSSTQTQMFVATGIPGDAYQADARCNAAEFQDVDTLWQIEHEHQHDPGDASFGSQNYDPATDDPRFAP